MFKACVFCEDEFEEVLEFNTEAEREAYSNGVSYGAGKYGGSCYLAWDAEHFCLNGSPYDQTELWELVKYKLGIQ